MEKLEDYRTRTLDSYLSDPIFGNTFKAILKFCTTPRTKDEIEQYVEKDLGVTYEKYKVFAGYFIGALEASGGLRWDKELRKWVATEIGKKAFS
jgi:hypothetical protein